MQEGGDGGGARAPPDRSPNEDRVVLGCVGNWVFQRPVDLLGFLLLRDLRALVVLGGVGRFWNDFVQVTVGLRLNCICDAFDASSSREVRDEDFG